MQLLSQRRLKVGLAAAAAALLGAVTLSTPAVSDETFAIPGSPEKVTISQATGGFRVFWSGVKSSPATSHYIISGGVGTCPVIVPASKTNAYVPAVNFDPVKLKVQAVNEYGISSGKESELVAPASTNRDYRAIQILQLSDFHGQVEGSGAQFGAALLAANFQAERERVAGTFTVSSGDNIGAAPPISSQFAEVPTIEAMNAMGFDASVFGNHEHDRDLAHLRQMIRKSDFQWVASNYSSLRGLDAGNDKKARTFTIVQRGGVKVGFIGVNTAQTVEQIMPGNLDFTIGGKKQTIKISENLGQIRSAAAAARAAGAQAVVALVHEGWNANANGKATGPAVNYTKQLSNQVDMVYSAHSHLTYNSVFNNTMLAQVRNAGVEYNRTQMCVNVKTKKVIGTSNELVTKANAPVAVPNPALATLIAGYKTQLNAKLDVKVGRVNIMSPIAGTPPVQRSGEHAFANWSSDVVRAKYGTDFALTNGGGIRSTFPATNYSPGDKSIVRPTATSTEGPWDVLLGDVYTVHPFGNVFSVIEVTGTQLWAALENGVSNYPADGRWPHVSGMKFTVDVSKAKGSRIVSIVDLKGNPVPKDGTKFTLALTDFVAKGGDGYNMFDISKLQVRDLDADVLVEALRADMAAGKVTEMKLDGRVTVLGK